MKNKSTRYLVSAIFFTILSAIAGGLFLITNANLFAKGCAIVLVSMCVISQWMRYNRFK